MEYLRHYVDALQREYHDEIWELRHYPKTVKQILYCLHHIDLQCGDIDSYRGTHYVSHLLTTTRIWQGRIFNLIVKKFDTSYDYSRDCNLRDFYVYYERDDGEFKFRNA